MTATIVTDYLLELSDALADVPRETRVAILAGVREELEGLEGDEAAARIRSIGDPAFIAAGAREDVPTPPSEPRWIVIVAALLIMVGGVIVPFVGWLAGVVLMWVSRSWSLRVKLLATLLPALAALESAFVVSVIALLPAEEAEPGGFHGPSLDEFSNPLIPSVFDVMWSSVTLGIPIAVVVGVWLLVIAFRPPAPTLESPRWNVIPVIAGSLLLPPAGWIVGLVLLWTSKAPARTKQVMTTVGPVALILSVALVYVFTRDPVVVIPVAMVGPFLASLVAAILLLRKRSLR